MNPTLEQIANAARLVPEHAKVHRFADGEILIRVGTRDWQPWADTEAGRSDALVLLAAVYKAAVAMTPAACLCEDCAPWYVAVFHALESGNVQQIQQATFDAAVAIGEHIGGSDEG